MGDHFVNIQHDIFMVRSQEAEITQRTFNKHLLCELLSKGTEYAMIIGNTVA